MTSKHLKTQASSSNPVVSNTSEAPVQRRDRIAQLRGLDFAAQTAALSPDTADSAATRAGGALPLQLQRGVEQLSGYDMSDVKVHYSSLKPAQLGAHAYAQGTDIHVAPGQERHLPHEAWHVAQQKQGRVAATTQMKKTPINNAPGLEREADVMGERAMQATLTPSASPIQQRGSSLGDASPVQRVGGALPLTPWDLLLMYAVARVMRDGPRLVGYVVDRLRGDSNIQQIATETAGTEGKDEEKVEHLAEEIEPRVQNVRIEREEKQEEKEESSDTEDDIDDESDNEQELRLLSFNQSSSSSSSTKQEKLPRVMPRHENVEDDGEWKSVKKRPVKKKVSAEERRERRIDDAISQIENALSDAVGRYDFYKKGERQGCVMCGPSIQIDKDIAEDVYQYFLAKEGERFEDIGTIHIVKKQPPNNYNITLHASYKATNPRTQVNLHVQS